MCYFPSSIFAFDRFTLLPAAVDPEPVGRVAAHGDFKRAVHVAHDVGDGARLAVFARGNFVADFDLPVRQADAVANGGVQRAVVAQGKNRRRGGGRRSRGRETACAVRRGLALVGEQAEQQAGVVHVARFSAAPSVRRSKKRQPERSRSDCIRRLSAGWFSAR